MQIQAHCVFPLLKKELLSDTKSSRIEPAFVEFIILEKISGHHEVMSSGWQSLSQEACRVHIAL